MNWLNYFIALGLPPFLILFTFILAVTFINSDFLKNIFVWSLAGGVLFEMVWIFAGVVIAVMGAVGD